jgi:hypothetical protein
MIREFIERTLKKVFATHAREPDPEHMTRTERREAAETNQPSGRGQTDDFADASESAAAEARGASESMPPMESDYVDDTRPPRQQANAASEEDGSYLEAELADESHGTADDARQASPHEPPRSDLADDSDKAREDAERANARSD